MVMILHRISPMKLPDSNIMTRMPLAFANRSMFWGNHANTTSMVNLLICHAMVILAVEINAIELGCLENFYQYDVFLQRLNLHMITITDKSFWRAHGSNNVQSHLNSNDLVVCNYLLIYSLFEVNLIK